MTRFQDVCSSGGGDDITAVTVLIIVLPDSWYVVIPGFYPGRQWLSSERQHGLLFSFSWKISLWWVKRLSVYCIQGQLGIKSLLPVCEILLKFCRTSCFSHRFWKINKKSNWMRLALYLQWRDNPSFFERRQITRSCVSSHTHITIQSYTHSFGHTRAHSTTHSSYTNRTITEHTVRRRLTLCMFTDKFNLFPSHKPNIYSCSDMCLNDVRAFQQ